MAFHIEISTRKKNSTCSGDQSFPRFGVSDWVDLVRLTCNENEVAFIAWVLHVFPVLLLCNKVKSAIPPHGHHLGYQAHAYGVFSGLGWEVEAERGYHR